MTSTPSRLQRAVDGAGDLVRQQHPSARLAFDRVDVLGELGGDHDLVADGCERLADEFLVGVRSVDLGGVEERDAQRRRRRGSCAIISLRSGCWL